MARRLTLPYPSIRQQQNAIDVLMRAAMFADETHQMSDEVSYIIQSVTKGTDREAAHLIANALVGLASKAIPDLEEWKLLLLDHINKAIKLQRLN